MAKGKNTQFIKWFSETRIEDVPLVGGKNAALGEMYSTLVPLGVNVPDGFALTADAYRYFFNEMGLDKEIREILSDLDTHDMHNLQVRGAKVRAAIVKAELPKDLKELIAKAYAE